MTNHRPLVSVLVTVYNRAAFLQATLESILASVFSDFEVLVVDDCSTDGSLNIAYEIAQTDSRIKVYANEKNLGDYGNRMHVAGLACGTYLKYVDSDDLIYPHSLGVMVNSLDRHESAAVALSHSLPEDEQPYPWLLSPEEAYRKHFLGRGCFGCGPSGAIIRRAAFAEVGGFRREWGVLSDIDLWLRMAARWPVLLLPPGLVWWRRHEGQEFSCNDAALVYLQRGFELTIQTLNEASCPMSSDARDAAVGKASQNYARKLLALGTKGRRPRIAWQFFRDSRLTLGQLAKGIFRYQTEVPMARR